MSTAAPEPPVRPTLWGVPRWLLATTLAVGVLFTVLGGISHAWGLGLFVAGFIPAVWGLWQLLRRRVRLGGAALGAGAVMGLAGMVALGSGAQPVSAAKTFVTVTAAPAPAVTVTAPASPGPTVTVTATATAQPSSTPTITATATVTATATMTVTAKPVPVAVPRATVTRTVTVDSSEQSTTRTGLVGSSADTDPQFATCKAAKAAGYGPYREGRDTEYAWYNDRDQDGVVCE